MLNEAVVEKTVPGHTIRLAASISGRPFVTYAADGLIVATPTGSTAYNLSVRGPIVSPGLRALVVTPVSPHMLFDRVLVLESEQWLRLEVSPPRSAVIVLDGLSVTELSPVTRWCVGPARCRRRFVTFGPRDFHAILQRQVQPGRPLRKRRQPFMLVELTVRDLGVIELTSVDLGPGMTALTGETGAGKTLIVEALDLLLGGRADPALVRPGANEALVEGRFVVDDEEIILARAVAGPGPVPGLGGRTDGARDCAGRDGGTACRPPRPARPTVAAVGGRPAPLLGRVRAHRSRTARSGPAPVAGLLESELDAFGGEGRARAREADLLRYQLDEIDARRTVGPDEDDALAAEKRTAWPRPARIAAAGYEALAALDRRDDGHRRPRRRVSAPSIASARPRAALGRIARRSST